VKSKFYFEIYNYTQKRKWSSFANYDGKMEE